MADPDAPAQKRLRLDSVNPVHNGHTFPPPSLPPHTRHLSHPTPAHVSSPSPSRQYPSHSLPPPSQPYPSPSQASYSGHQPSPSLPLSDIRAFADPRTIPSPGQRPHGVSGPSPVTAGVPPDSISTYRAPPTPQSAAASEPTESKPPPGMEHGNHPHPWSVAPDHRPNGSMSGGYNPTISPPHPTDPAYHPPPPPPGQPYGQQAPYAPSPYVTQYPSPGQAQVRRKQVRATQACNHCRARKQKCDEARPCQFCRENSFDCQYKDVPPPKQDRSMMQLQDSMNSMSDTLSNFLGEFSAWRQDVEARLPPRSTNLDSREGVISAPPRDMSASRLPTPMQARTQPARVNSMKLESPINVPVSTPIKQEAVLPMSQQPATPAESVRTDTSHSFSVGVAEKAGLQSDHSTPAHNLLKEWPVLREWVKDVDYLAKLRDNGRDVNEYPMQLEQARGILRPWGFGEGLDMNDGAQGPGSPESSNDSEAPSPAPAREGLWGHVPVDKASPSSMNGSTSREHFDHPGGLGPDGRPDFRSAVMDQLLASYHQNMRNLHPFLNHGKLQKMFREFKEQNSPDVKAANVASPASSQLNPGMKRKRSNSAFGDSSSNKGSIERSLRNAIVLLVLALGKVCSYKERVPLPSPQTDKGSQANGAWGSFAATSHPNGSFNSDTSEDNRSRNIDIMPGMAYYAYATDILGNHHGGHTVAHAQAFILAALYIGQFARVLESWSWITSACRVAIVLLKADFYRLQRKFFLEGEIKKVTAKEHYKLDLVLFVFWTCVQLESDIIAEMSTLPTSNVTEHQSTVMYPAGVFESLPLDPVDGVSLAVAQPRNSLNSDQEMMIYSSQIYLRVILNDAHNTLYGAKDKSKSFDRADPKAVADNANGHLGLLNSWRGMLPAYLAWDDEEPPSTDLNVARLRAKYYGALYMMLRPCLQLASKGEWPPSHQASQQRMQWSQHSSPANTGEAPMSMSRGVQMVELNPGQNEMVKLAQMCIHAAIRSTIAFDRVGAPVNSPYVGYKSTRTQRLVLTNIFGTMHAQFGNMLVLAAVYKSKMYSHLPEDTPLTPKTLAALFERTISALEETAPNSPILQVDLDILHTILGKLDLPKP
ncbi:hypothetical protein IQ06DRAFT_81458 [Phaeosphaeriaceae sp. SRC1lsM3a]|nr:hypothetical protein IQ06DRAFT_81458 [Stagonospora sp. SRC1lsM3a]